MPGRWGILPFKNFTGGLSGEMVRLGIDGYLNDFAFDPDNPNSSPLKLPNITHISCLMYVDDIILISRTFSGLQNSLDTVNGFYTN